MNIQFIRLDADVCDILNRMAGAERRTVSDLANEILKNHLKSASADLPTTNGSAE